MKSYPEFHDGFLEGLWIDSKTVHVYLATVHSERFTAVAGGVVALAASGFRVGNVILDVLSRNCDELTLEDISELYELTESSIQEGQREKLLVRAKEHELTVLEINPSYGATCLLLAKSVHLLPRQEWLARYLAIARA